MIIDYRDGTNTDHDVIDLETGKHPNESIFYADDEAGIYRTYLIKPGCEGLRCSVYYLWHKVTHKPLPSGRTIYRGDWDEDDWEVAWAERRRAIKIVPRQPAAAEQETWRDRSALL